MPEGAASGFGPFPWLAAKRRQGRKRSCSPGCPSLGCIWTQGVNVDSAVGRWGSENCVYPPATSASVPIHRPPDNQEITHSIRYQGYQYHQTVSLQIRKRRQRIGSEFRCICATSAVYNFERLSRSTSRRERFSPFFASGAKIGGSRSASYVLSINPPTNARGTSVGFTSATTGQ